jgi:hypothetical protein
MECSTRPLGWRDSIIEYISHLNKNSFFLGNLHSNLRYNYQLDFMNNSEQRDSEFLIKASWAKHYNGTTKPGIGTVAKVPDRILPKREADDNDLIE